MNLTNRGSLALASVVLASELQILACGTEEPLGNTGSGETESASPSAMVPEVGRDHSCPDVELEPASFETTYAVALTVHTPHSALSEASLCSILDEVNEIWWSQAGICFEIEISDGEQSRGSAWDLWFERSAPFANGLDVNGVYLGDHEIYTLDHPTLAPALEPTRAAAARTAAHELGHALGLRHQNCGEACLDLLMTSGRRGYQLVASSPADTDEIERSRAVAESRVGLEAKTSPSDGWCPAPRWVSSDSVQ